jgi:hypothetical protein
MIHSIAKRGVEKSMGNTVYDIQSAYIHLLEENLQDPNQTRREKGQKWIYDDLPILTAGQPAYPRISVIEATSNIISHEVGSTRRRFNSRIEIQIRWHKHTKPEGKLAAQCVNDMASQVDDILKSEDASDYLLENTGVFYTFLEQESVSFPGDLIVKSMIYKNIMVR